MGVMQCLCTFEDDLNCVIDAKQIVGTAVGGERARTVGAYGVIATSNEDNAEETCTLKIVNCAGPLTTLPGHEARAPPAEGSLA